MSSSDTSVTKTPPRSRRRFPAAIFSPAPACALIVLLASCAAAKPASVAYRNSIRLPDSTTDQNDQPFTITGLSGITYRRPLPGGPNNHEFLAVMDNSNKLVRLRVTLAADGSLASADVLGGISLPDSRDFEGVALAPGGLSVLLSEEGTPAVAEYSLQDAHLVRQFPTPQVYLNHRSNYGFESLTLRTVGPAPTNSITEVWTANEEALSVDGPLSTQSAGCVVRLQRYALAQAGATPTHEFAYQTDPWNGSSITGARSGVSDLVTLPDGELLTLERSFAFNLAGFFRTRIYQVRFTTPSGPATDVSSVPALQGASYTPVSKRLLWQGNLANLEGVCLGPSLGAKRWAMLGVVDDADPISQNTLVGFEISQPLPQPKAVE